LLLTASARFAGAQPPENDPVYHELQVLREGLTEAVNKNDLEKLLSFVHEDVIVTWLDGEQSRGHDEVRAYYRSKMGGDNAVVKRFVVEPVVTNRAFHGNDMEVVYGTAVSRFTMTTGQELTVDGPWSATIVKDQDGDRWRLAAFHASAGMFDNPLLNAVKTFAIGGIVIAGLLGLLLGMVVLWLVRKFRRPRAMADA
jgi:uncharacterized protein (TIGR02246 family)